MKRWLTVCGVMLLFSVAAMAQDNSKVEVFGGYSYLMYRPDIANSPGSPTSVNFNGGVGSVAVNLNNWIGGVAEFAGYHAGTIDYYGAAVPGESANAVSYLFGPKVSMTKWKITPFAQALFGGVHGSLTTTSGTVSQNAFAMALGGGLDWNATRHIAVRLGQVEYMMTRFGNSVSDGIGSDGTGQQNSFRYSAGVIFRF